MSSAYEKDMRNAVEFIPDRLYYVALSSPPPISHPQKHFFSIDNEMVYWNFYLDFGPLNLGHCYRYCMLINNKLNDKKLKDKVIYHYSSSHVHKRTNAAFLICAWALLYMNKSPEDAFKPFKGYPHPFPPWHDATPVACTYNLTILDTLRGLAKARECRFFDFNKFNIEEYEHYEQVENGDLNWYVEGRFVAFAGPHAEKHASPGGYYSLRPEDYVPYFKKRNVTLVVRLNKSSYDGRKFSNNGIEHMELYFVDGSNPPDHILAKFLTKCEETTGAIAVHCKAGLGRTGTVIGCYIMKHYRFTAEEIIGWMRIVRPGSIIGPQQQYMRDVQTRMWREGEQYRARMAAAGAPTLPPVNPSPSPSPCPSPVPQREKEREDSKGASPPSPALLSRGIASLSVSGNTKSVVAKSAVGAGLGTSGSGSRLTQTLPESPAEKQTQGDMLRLRRQLHPHSPSNLTLSSSSSSTSLALSIPHALKSPVVGEGADGTAAKASADLAQPSPKSLSSSLGSLLNWK